MKDMRGEKEVEVGVTKGNKEAEINQIRKIEGGKEVQVEVEAAKV